MSKSLSAGFDTKRKHSRISPATEDKLLTLFNRTLFSGSNCTSSSDTIEVTTQQLARANRIIRSMPACKAKYALTSLAGVMNDKLAFEKRRLSTIEGGSLAHATTLADVVRRHWHDVALDPNLITDITAFTEARFGFSEHLVSGNDANEWLRLREDAGCASLSDARKEVNEALLQLKQIKVSAHYYTLCEVLCRLLQQFERDAHYWQGQLSKAASTGEYSGVAGLAVSWLGMDDPVVKMVRLNYPEFFRRACLGSA